MDELGAALQSGDQETVMQAFGKLSQVCHDCHRVNMPKVQQKYHWGDFSEVSAVDPVTGEDVNFAQLMMGLESSYGGIMVDLEQGQVENALQYYDNLSGWFDELEASCDFCHDTERRYFVDESIWDMIDQLGILLRNDPIDMPAIGALAQGIGGESCSKCHLVHVPAAFTQARWEMGDHSVGE